MERICDHNLERYHLGMVKDEAELAPIEEHLLAPVFLVSVEMNPRTVCFCQPVFSHNLLQCGAAGAGQQVAHDRLLAELAWHPRRAGVRGGRGYVCPGFWRLCLLRGVG